MASAYNVKVERYTQINWSAMHTYINKTLVLEYIISWEVHVLCGDCLPVKEVLAVCLPEGTRRWGTGTGGMVVREVTGGGVSSTVREEGGSKYGLELVMCMCNVSLTSVDDFVAGVVELAVRVF